MDGPGATVKWNRQTRNGQVPPCVLLSAEVFEG